MSQGTKPTTILIVDDNTDSRELLIKLLAPRGYRTVEAVDGEDALEKASSLKPDLILIDQSLPKISGYEVTRRLKEIDAFHSIPIVALTAHAMRGEKEKAMKAGCDGYIAKPIDVRALPGIIDSYLKHG